MAEIGELIAFIRVRNAIGDPEGKLMQDEVIDRVQEMVRENAELKRMRTDLQARNTELVLENRKMRARLGKHINLSPGQAQWKMYEEAWHEIKKRDDSIWRPSHTNSSECLEYLWDIEQRQDLDKKISTPRRLYGNHDWKNIRHKEITDKCIAMAENHFRRVSEIRLQKM